MPGFEKVSIRDLLADVDQGWLDHDVWAAIRTYSGPYTAGYFANAVDLQLTEDGIAQRPPNERIYLRLFVRTFVMSLVITGACILLGYPVAYLLANLPARRANL